MARSPDDIYEELLVIRCRRHDLDAWDELVRRLNPRLTYYLGRFTRDEDQTGSLLQDVWLRALRNLKSLNDERRFAAWIYAIAHRVVMDHFREEYSRPEQAGSDAVARYSGSETNESARFEDAELVHFGLSRIGWIEREVLTLCFLEELSVAEIAEVLDVPVGTVKSRLHRARAELRTVLEAASESPQRSQPTHANDSGGSA